MVAFAAPTTSRSYFNMPRMLQLTESDLLAGEKRCQHVDKLSRVKFYCLRTDVAIKRFEDVFMSKTDALRILREIAILRRLEHRSSRTRSVAPAHACFMPGT